MPLGSKQSSISSASLSARQSGEPFIHRNLKRLISWKSAAMMATAAMVAIYFGLPAYWNSQAKKSMKLRQYDVADRLLKRVEKWQAGNAKASLDRAINARRMGECARSQAILQIAEFRGSSRKQINFESKLNVIQAGASRLVIDQLPEMLVQFPERGPDILDAFIRGLAVGGDYQNALQYVDGWIETAADDPLPFLRKGELLMSAQRLSEAESYLTMSIQMDSNPHEAEKSLALLYEKTGNKIEALKILERETKANPTNVDLQLLMCNVLFGLNRDADAAAVLREVLRTHPLHFTATHALASSLAERGQPAEVIELVKPLLHEFPHDVSLSYLMAWANLELGDATESDRWMQIHLDARRSLNRLFVELKKSTTGSQSRPDYLGIANEYFQYQWDKAEPALARAISNSPRSADAYRAMAKFSEMKGDPGKAADFNKAAESLRNN